MILINEGHPRSEVARYPLATLFYAIEKLIEKHGGKDKSGRARRASPDRTYDGIDKNSPLIQRMKKREELIKKRAQIEGS